MSDLARQRRRRADAERSITAILDAATRVLGERPNASMEDIARAAGVTRQTVYAHFPSREVLLEALLNRATDRAVSTLDSADLEKGPAGEALLRFFDISWKIFTDEPFLLHLAMPTASAEQVRDQHQPIIGPLGRIIRRGRRSGEFDRTLPVGWYVAATIALGHAASDEVRAGRMSAGEASKALKHSISKLFTSRTTT